LIRTFRHSEFPLELLLERKREGVTVVLPAREVAATIGRTIEQLQSLGALIDQILVVDAASRDGTAEIAARLGAEVHQEAELLAEHGPVLGKGDAMWRALSVARGELVAYLDSDTRNFSEHFARGLLGPLLCHEKLCFVKGSFQRPFVTPDGQELPVGGGRVTELTARPLLDAFYPELAGFAQPLAGELAARRWLFDRLPFATGYAVEIAMLFDVLDVLGGTSGMAQVDLELRHNPHQPLAQLAPMARTVLAVVVDRLRRDGRLQDAAALPELVARPPYAELRARA
jgi:glucosyl-3-phosphoglycerate synthase